MKKEDPDERTWLKGLAVECPLGKAVPSCPLNGLRNLPTLQIRTIIRQMNNQQVHAAIQAHQHCFNERTAAMRKAGHPHTWSH